MLYNKGDIVGLISEQEYSPDIEYRITFVHQNKYLEPLQAGEELNTGEAMYDLEPVEEGFGEPKFKVPESELYPYSD